MNIPGNSLRKMVYFAQGNGWFLAGVKLFVEDIVFVKSMTDFRINAKSSKENVKDASALQLAQRGTVDDCDRATASAARDR